ncbi:type II toxin-antitoxin system PemK/MazF family toxin [Chamaesiphon sp. GL140_3_metabinner_50]|uniref:type II toxin-antitoxin system PemK/MazF family toxin n=1 Tax=Chamaesiphon sp. GL140_3_metabinner_50 TaxID=2970812 RepID=UPI0026009BC5|nr:type II toxin-antitoxin system PemK/MazF family toxin [Chamaesiphon sp. GL140_3_metabinner_50]
MGVVVARFDVFLVELDPTVGSEIWKTRPCLIISPDEMNLHLATAIVAPMTTKGKLYPSRIPVNSEGKDGYIVLDQIRTVDKTRLIKKLGSIAIDEQKAVLNTLAEMFAED